MNILIYILPWDKYNITDELLNFNNFKLTIYYSDIINNKYYIYELKKRYDPDKIKNILILFPLDIYNFNNITLKNINDIITYQNNIINSIMNYEASYLKTDPMLNASKELLLFFFVLNITVNVAKTFFFFSSRYFNEFYGI